MFNIFLGGRDPKNDQDRAKKPSFFDQKLWLISFFLKNLQVNPNWKFPNFSQYFSNTFLEFFHFQKFHLEPLFNPFWKKCQKSHLPGNSSYTKTSLTKSVPNDTSPCSKFFFRVEIQKITKIEPKNPLFWPKIAVNQFFL